MLTRLTRRHGYVGPKAWLAEQRDAWPRIQVIVLQNRRGIGPTTEQMTEPNRNDDTSQ